ncbi:hypothetical protein JCM8547_007065 [Rhodosporidiobolus lusitaniae]
MQSATRDLESSAEYDRDRKSESPEGSEHGNDVHHDAVHITEGVRRMEAVAEMGYATKEGRVQLYTIAAAIFITNADRIVCIVLLHRASQQMYWMYCQQSSTTYNYSVWATSSFADHSGGIAALNIATGIISSVVAPFLAKMADVWSRVWLCWVALISYTVGFIIILKSPTLAAYVVGNVFTAIGGSGLGLLSSILAADLVPLKFRGLAQGILSAPYIVIPWYTAEIVNALANDNNWRWGYGMYSIIMPVIMIPCTLVLVWLEWKAKKHGIITAASSGQSRLEAAAAAEKEGRTDNTLVAVKPSLPLGRRLLLAWQELDGMGLLLLGFAWSLILLPFSLYSTAKGGYSNPSLIAMFCVGGVLLFSYVGWEWKFAVFPSAPKRLLVNRTFMTAIVIDFIYELAGYMQLQYLSSYVYIVTDYNSREWTYYSNTLTVALCAGGVLAGVIQYYTRRYKFLQIAGLALKIVGYGLLVDRNGVHDTARLVLSQVFTGIGGSFSVVGSQVGSQASVPHQDVALAISLLQLWTAVGAGVGQAVAVAVWSNRMPGNLAHYMPASVNSTQIETFFSDITTIKEYDYSSPIRQGAIKAYEATVFPLWAGALGLSFIPLICACFQSNFYLGDAQNAYDHKDATGKVVQEKEGRHVKAEGWRRVMRFWDL